MSQYQYNQAPKDLESQSAKWRKALPADWLEGYVIQPKYDGCLAIVDTVGQRIISREGKLVTSMPHVLAGVTKLFPGKVVFGEAWCFDTAFKDVSGKFRRAAPQADLQLVAWDVVPHADWLAGYSAAPYAHRIGLLNTGRDNPTIGLIYPCEGLRVLDMQHAQNFANAMVATGGYDGAILRDMIAPWKTGASRDGAVIKIKPTKSLDLRVVDWFPGNGKYIGAAGGIVVEYRGVRTEVGTGLTDAERGAAALGEYTGKVAEVEFMDVTTNGKLREPRFKGIRYDKTQPDE